jgi:hypothetical protein
MNLKFVAMKSSDAQEFRNGHLDANGQAPEQHEEGFGPCRHCLSRIEGEAMLALSYKPFDSNQAYAESGPIFLHQKACKHYDDFSNAPKLFADETDLIVRGYTKEDRIQYTACRITSSQQLTQTCKSLFEDSSVSYLHVRLGPTNCYQYTVERA